MKLRKGFRQWVLVIASILQLSSSAYANQCKFVNVPSFDFGRLNLLSAVNLTITRKIEFWCTSGMSYELKDNKEEHSNSYNLWDQKRKYSINYTIAYGANKKGIGQGENVTITVPVTLKIYGNNYLRVAVGQYYDQLYFSLVQ